MANRIVLYLAELRKLIPYADQLVDLAAHGPAVDPPTATVVGQMIDDTDAITLADGDKIPVSDINGDPAGILKHITWVNLQKANGVKRVSALTDDTRPVIVNCDNYDVVRCYGLTTDFTVSLPTGTPTDCQTLIYKLKDNGTARLITWGTGVTQFISRGYNLPTTTLAGKLLTVGFMYNITTSTWDCIGGAQE